VSGVEHFLTIASRLAKSTRRKKTGIPTGQTAKKAYERFCICVCMSLSHSIDKSPRRKAFVTPDVESSWNSMQSQAEKTPAETL
jgi:hypothetical protein